MTLKRLAWIAYGHYYESFPLERGKYLLGRAIRALLGPVVCRLDGGVFELDPVGLVDRRLLLRRRHDTVVLDLIREVLVDGGTFVDVGANAGYFSVLAALLPNVQVLAFEPSPRELARLFRHLQLNSLGNVTVFPFGLSDRAALEDLWVARDSNPGMNSTRQLTGRGNLGKISRPFKRFTDLVPASQVPGIKLVKLDVEGAEMKVLRGLETEMGALSFATFVVEISPEWLASNGSSVDEIYEFFNSHGLKPTSGLSRTGQYDEVFRPGR